MTTREAIRSGDGVGPHRSGTSGWRSLLRAVYRSFALSQRGTRIRDMPDWLQRDLGYEPNGPRLQVTDTAVRLLLGTTR